MLSYREAAFFRSVFIMIMSYEWSCARDFVNATGLFGSRGRIVYSGLINFDGNTFIRKNRFCSVFKRTLL